MLLPTGHITFQRRVQELRLHPPSAPAVWLQFGGDLYAPGRVDGVAWVGTHVRHSGMRLSFCLPSSEPAHVVRCE